MINFSNIWKKPLSRGPKSNRPKAQLLSCLAYLALLSVVFVISCDSEDSIESEKPYKCTDICFQTCFQTCSGNRDALAINRIDEPYKSGELVVGATRAAVDIVKVNDDQTLSLRNFIYVDGFDLSVEKSEDGDEDPDGVELTLDPEMVKNIRHSPPSLTGLRGLGAKPSAKVLLVLRNRNNQDIKNRDDDFVERTLDPTIEVKIPPPSQETEESFRAWPLKTFSVLVPKTATQPSVFVLLEVIDTDGDGKLDLGEDGVAGGGDDDNCPGVPNANQNDLDRKIEKNFHKLPDGSKGDGMGDECDPDHDGDGIRDEKYHGPDECSTIGEVEVAWKSDEDTDPDEDGCRDDILVDDNKTYGEEDFDDDNDGLIEIRNLDMLHNIRYNLAGTSYNGDVRGAPPSRPSACAGRTTTRTTTAYLCGYELTRDLDFADKNSYADRAVNTNWCPGTNDCNSSNVRHAGFPGLGATTSDTTNSGFQAIFEGNGHKISNLYMRNTTNGEKYAGLFRLIEASAVIRNLGLENANVYGRDAADQRVGALVGLNRGASKIISSYAKGGTVNGDANTDNVGGLVGRLDGASLIACYATGTVNGGGGTDSVGGLVGYANAGSITATYSTGAVNGDGGC